jgi:hypothetical protein
MHIIALVIVVAFIQTVGVEKPPEIHTFYAPNATIEECKSAGAQFVAKLRQVEGIASAEFDCHDFLMKAAV